MLEAGIPPDVQAMNSLINAFSKAGSPDEALKVSKEQNARFRYDTKRSAVRMYASVRKGGAGGRHRYVL